MRFCSNLFKVLAIVAAFFAMAEGQAQNQTFSPFSRFGIGKLNSQASSFQRLSLNSDIAFVSKALPNFSNAAALASLQAPIFDASFTYNNTRIENNLADQNLVSGAIGPIVLALPINKGFALGLNLAPISSVGYRSTSSLTQDSIEAKIINQGSGGINEAGAAVAYNFLHKQDSIYFALGTKVAYTFGTIFNERSIEFTDAFFKNTQNSKALSLSDLRYEFSALYSKYLNKKVKLGLALVYSPSVNLNRSFSELSRNYVSNSQGVRSFRDTVLFTDEKEGQVTFPGSLQFGFNIELNRKWFFSGAITRAQWSDFSQELRGERSSFGTSDLLESNIGVRFKPSTQTTLNESVLKQSVYSFGFRFSEGYVNVDNTDIRNTALSAGVSIPFRKSGGNSHFHLGTEIGTQGEKDLIQEKYLRIFFGLSISPRSIDRWFYKRKYN